MPRCAARATLVSPSVAASHRTAQPRSAPPQRIHAPPPSPTATARQPNPRQARHPHAASPIHPPEHPPDRFTPHQRTTRQRCCCPVPSQTAQQPPPHAQLYAARRHPPPCHRARSCCARCAPTQSRALNRMNMQSRARHQQRLVNTPGAQANADVAVLRHAPATPRAVSTARAGRQAARAPVRPAHHQAPPDTRPVAVQALRSFHGVAVSPACKPQSGPSASCARAARAPGNTAPRGDASM
jgi:hypothetical protein